MKKRKKRVVMERLTTLSEAGNRSFDIMFWQRQSAQKRFAAAWSALDDFYRMRGINGYKLRLQRSVQNIKYSQG